MIKEIICEKTLKDRYSGVPIKIAGSIKQAGWNFHNFSQTKQDLIRASKVEFLEM